MAKRKLKKSVSEQTSGWQTPAAPDSRPSHHGREGARQDPLKTKFTPQFNIQRHPKSHNNQNQSAIKTKACMNQLDPHLSK